MEKKEHQFSCPPPIDFGVDMECSHYVAPSIQSLKIFTESKSVTDQNDTYLGQWELSEDKKTLIATNSPLIRCVGFEPETKEPILFDATDDPNSVPHWNKEPIVYHIQANGLDLTQLEE